MAFVSMKDMDGNMLREAEALVKKHMAQYDPSHDWAHVARVRQLALRIAETIIIPPDMVVVELAALFHDMAVSDAKYDPTSPLSSLLSPFFESEASSALSQEQRDLILKIVPSVSWSTESKLRKAGQWTEWHATCPELHAVQDADRLDAVGAVGVMRCAAFSGIKGRKLLDDGEGSETAEGHFADKLLLIRDRMKTGWGREEAERRHSTMLSFLKALSDEKAAAIE